MAHARLVGARQFQEQLKHCDHQAVSVIQPDSTGRQFGGTSRKPECQPQLTITMDSRQPQIMGVFEHRQSFAAVELHGEFSAELVKALMLLECRKDLLSQVSRIEQHLRINARTRTQHKVAHIVARRLRWAEARRDQTFDQCSFVLANASNLHICPVGGLDHRTGITLRTIGNGVSLHRAQHTSGEFYATDTTVSGLHNSQ
ncbi:hypothetical protein D3C84_359840 [compost metagenome]